MMLAGEVAWAVGADLQELPCFCQSRTQGHIQAEYCDCALTSVVYRIPQVAVPKAHQY